MKSLIASALSLSLLLAACHNRVRKAPPVAAPGNLITGCYDIVEDSTAIPRRLLEDSKPGERYFIDPDPIITVGDFESVEITDKYGPYCLKVDLSKPAAETWTAATKIRKGKKLAFIIDNELVMAPQVYGEMKGGSFEISGNFKEETLKLYQQLIERDMYK